MNISAVKIERIIKLCCGKCHKYVHKLFNSGLIYSWFFLFLCFLVDKFFHVYGFAGYIRILMNIFAFAICFSDRKLFSLLYFIRWENMFNNSLLLYVHFPHVCWLHNCNIIEYFAEALCVMHWMAGLLGSSTKV